MARMATNEYIGAKRRMYTTADRKRGAESWMKSAKQQGTNANTPIDC